MNLCKFTVTFFLVLICGTGIQKTNALQWSPITNLGNDISIEAVVAVNVSGQAVAAWTFYDGSNARIQTATLSLDGVWTIIPDFPSPAGSDALMPSVSINPNGTAVVVWELDTPLNPGIPSIIQAATLPNGSTTWSAPQDLTALIPATIDEIFDSPLVGTDATGHAYAVWSDFESSITHVRAAKLTINTNTWELLNTDLGNPGGETNCLNLQFAVAPSGYAIIMWESTEIGDASIHSAILPANGTTFTQTPHLSPDNIDAMDPKIAINAQGNAVSVWYTVDSGINTIQGALLPFGATAWTPTIELTNIGIVIEPQVSINDNGYAAANWIFIDGVGFEHVQAAVLLPSQTTWTTPVDISVPSELTRTTSISVDMFGNALSVWTRDNGASRDILQYATLPFGGTWSNPIDLTTADLSINAESLATAPFGYSVLIYEGFDLSDDNVVQGLFTILPAPLPPRNFTGKTIKNKFLNTTEYANELKWSPSLDPTIVAYKLSRNGVLIATIGPTGPFSYLDRDRKKNKEYTYSLSAVRSNGTESPAVVVILP
jgi:hypothetical protein